MKIQVVVPAINLWSKYSKACIDSIKSSKHELRILFIDNASVDETCVEAGKLVSAHFSHKRNEERWGVSQSWNYGIRDAWERGYDYCLVLNNDILLHPDCIDRMVERFQQAGSENLGMITAMDVRGECATPQEVFSKNIDAYGDLAEAPHPNFSCYMINKTCWDKVGEFDEGFFPAYYEDNDYHRRMDLAGVKAVVYPPALFYHYGSRTQNEALDKPLADSGQTGRYFISKWGGVPDQKDLYTHPLNNPQNSFRGTKQNNYV